MQILQTGFWVSLGLGIVIYVWELVLQDKPDVWYKPSHLSTSFYTRAEIIKHVIGTYLAYVVSIFHYIYMKFDLEWLLKPLKTTFWPFIKTFIDWHAVSIGFKQMANTFTYTNIIWVAGYCLPPLFFGVAFLLMHKYTPLWLETIRKQFNMMDAISCIVILGRIYLPAINNDTHLLLRHPAFLILSSSFVLINLFVRILMITSQYDVFMQWIQSFSLYHFMSTRLLPDQPT